MNIEKTINGKTIGLKNIKHSRFASQETHCYQATIYIDGNRFCQVQNDGHGGSDYYSPIGSTTNAQLHEKVSAINSILGEVLVPRNDATYVNDAGIERSSVFTLSYDLEIVCGELVNMWIQESEVKKALKKILYVEADGAVYSLQAKFKPTQANFDAVKRAKWWRPDNKILNELPFADARRIILSDWGV